MSQKMQPPRCAGLLSAAPILVRFVAPEKLRHQNPVQKDNARPRATPPSLAAQFAGALG
jgi:hypothetical protein